MRKPRVDLEQKLKEYRRELAEARAKLAEALEQQTATSEVLRVISSSPNDLDPVFQAMLANAVRVCGAKFGTLVLCDGDLLCPVARYNQPPELLAALRKLDARAYRLDRLTAMARAVRTKHVVHIADIKTEPRSYLDEPLAALYAKYGLRTLLAVPMLQENAVLGVIVMYRLQVRPFSNKQIELVQNFAAQAVIAIENTRLLNELRQRTDDLSEALEQRTATSEVLGVISSSPGELEPVFEAMLANAVRVCQADFGTLLRSEGDAFRVVALHRAPPAYAEERRRNPVVPANPGAGLARMRATKRTVQIADTHAEPGYRADPTRARFAETSGARTAIFVPMLKENEVVGAIVIYRQEVRPFTDKQIELVTTFADQAVIAIENTRLLNELRQRRTI
jgi:GAF domain-containing protein